jgi:hypothetical protein
MGGMPGGMGMPMNMGQMGGGMQGMINSNLNQIYMQNGQDALQIGKVHQAAFEVSQSPTVQYSFPLSVPEPDWSLWKFSFLQEPP